MGSWQAVEKVWPFLVVVHLIHRLTQADISCTTTARLFFFPLLGSWLSWRARIATLEPEVTPHDFGCVNP